MSDELDELTKDAEIETATEETETTGSTETVAATTEASTGEEGAATPAAVEPPAAHVPIAALMDERDKRQAAEAKLAQLETETRAPPPDADEDPKGAIEHLREEMRQARVQDRIDMSRAMVASQHEDFADKEVAFMKMAESNSQLVTQMLESPNPAQFAYDTVRQSEEMEALKDIDGYKARIRAEVVAEERAKLEAEMTTQAGRTAARAAATTLPNLATQTAASSETAVPTDGELSDICLGDNL